jgi:anti-sigma regulatory factor (Ser/Thr protein kinase)
MSVWTRRFSGGALAARAARRVVREQLGGELSAQQLGDVELLVSELAANSVRHAGCDEAGEISLEATVDDRRVRLRLCDHGQGFEDRTPPALPPERAGGLGLVLLDRLSNRWGTHRDGGFCVWFEVERARPA